MKRLLILILAFSLYFQGIPWAQASYAAVYPAMGRAAAITVQSALGLLLIYLSLGDKNWTTGDHLFGSEDGLTSFGISAEGLYYYRQEKITILNGEVDLLTNIKETGPNREKEVLFSLNDSKEDFDKETQQLWRNLFKKRSPASEKDFALWRVRRFNKFLRETEHRQKIWSHTQDMIEWRILVEVHIYERQELLDLLAESD